jgi:hypothetical protein
MFSPLGPILALVGPCLGAMKLSMVPYENWMSYFQDSPILELPIIPGSHNSGSAQQADDLRGCRSALFPWARQQSLPVAAQLRAGVRLLDIRLHVLDDMSIRVSHTFDTSYTLQEVLSDIEAFLSINDSEFIILYIRIDHENPLSEQKRELEQDAIAQALAISGVHLAHIEGTELTEITVKEVAGKVVLLSPRGSVLPVASSIPYLDSDRFYGVRDIWRCSFVNGPCGAKDRLNSYMCEPYTASDRFQGIAIDMTCPGFTPRTTSPGLNRWFMEKLHEDYRWIARRNEGPLGILVVDYVNRNTLGQIIELNLSSLDIHIEQGSNEEVCTDRKCISLCFGSFLKDHNS